MAGVEKADYIYIYDYSDINHIISTLAKNAHLRFVLGIAIQFGLQWTFQDCFSAVLVHEVSDGLSSFLTCGAVRRSSDTLQASTWQMAELQDQSVLNRTEHVISA